MKILLVGDYFSRNLGDQLLCRTVERIIQQRYQQVEIIPFDMSGKTGYHTYYSPSGYTWKQRLFFRLSYRAPGFCKRFLLLRTFMTDPDRHIRVLCQLDEVLEDHRIDLVVFAGGSIFMDYFAGVINRIVKRCSRRKIPVMFHACGTSTLSKDAIGLIQRALKCRNIKWVSLRDSYQRFSEIFSTSAIVKETCDTALYCSNIHSAAKIKQSEYGVGIMDIPEHYDFQKRMLQWFLNSDKDWKLFTNGSMADKLVTQKLVEELNIPQQNISPYPETVEEFVQTITGFEKVVSFRMHTQIVAASFGIPVYGIVWNAKIKTMLDKLGFTQCYGMPNEDMNFNDVCSVLQMEDSETLKTNAFILGCESSRALLEGIAFSVGEDYFEG